MSSNDIWKLPPDTIPTYITLRHGGELRVVSEPWEKSIVHDKLREILFDLLTPKAQIAIEQSGSTNHLQIEFRNMFAVVLARYARK